MAGNESDQRAVELKLLSQEFVIYSQPVMLMMNGKGGKRAEAAQWSLEVQKLLRGVVETIVGLENMMNHTEQSKKLFVNEQEITLSDEKKYWLMIYLIDNGILRLYACLEKIAQMCRCYLEYKEHGGGLKVKSRCDCVSEMDEKNCTFGSLLAALRDDKSRPQVIADALMKLDSADSIMELRPYRNTFTHRKHKLDQTGGLDPAVETEYREDGVHTRFSFGETLPSLNWFRVKMAQANNEIVDCVEALGKTIFPRDFELKAKAVPMPPQDSQSEIRDAIGAKIDAMEAEVQRIAAIGEAALRTKLQGKISFRFQSSAPRDLLTAFERAQSVCFVAKYESLPTLEAVNVSQRNGKFYMANMGNLRHILNEFRPIVQNKSDSVHYSRVHTFCYKKMNANPALDLSITVRHESGQDVTDDFKKILGERNRAIGRILAECEFDYIYNGILQHSDHEFTERFWREYADGTLNYVFIKHTKVLEQVRSLLYWHYRIVNALTFPKLGPL